MHKLLITTTTSKPSDILKDLFGSGLETEIKNATHILSTVLLLIATLSFLFYLILHGISCFGGGQHGREDFSEFWNKIKTGTIIFIVIAVVCGFGIAW